MRIAVTGATGYVGHHLLEALLAAGHSVVAISRHGARARAASNYPFELHHGVEYRHGDVAQGDGLIEAFADADAVIHLVGIIAESGKQTFERLHVRATENVMAAARSAGVKRYLHMSALGARPGAKSGYSSTKYQAEELVRASSLDWTIFRPSLIFGRGDDFFGHVLKNLVSIGPIVPVIGHGQFPFRPVWVGDVAAAYVQALDRPETFAKTFTLVGPREYTFEALLDLELVALGKKKPKIHIPVFLMNLAVPMMAILPHPPITRDQYLMLLEGNTGDPAEARSVFQLAERTLEETLPEILMKPTTQTSD